MRKHRIPHTGAFLLAILLWLLPCTAHAGWAEDGATETAINLEDRDAVEAELYRRIYEGMQNRTGYKTGEMIYLRDLKLDNRDGSKDQELLSRVYQKVMYDHLEELYYVRGEWWCWNGKGNIMDGVIPKYFECVTDPGADEAFQAAITKALKQVEGVTDPLDQMMILHDYLVTISAYNWEFGEGRPAAVKNNIYTEKDGFRAFSSDARCAYSALVASDNGTVCLGYANAYRVLLNRLDFECEVVGNDLHAWNMVRLWVGADGRVSKNETDAAGLTAQWFHIDVNAANNRMPVLRGRCSHKLFLVSDGALPESPSYETWSCTHYKDTDLETPHANNKMFETEQWIFADTYNTCPMLWEGGKFYYLTRNAGSNVCSLRYGTLSGDYEEIRSLVIKGGVVWAGRELYYVDAKHRLCRYCVDNGPEAEPTILGKIPYTPQPSQDEHYKPDKDGIGLYYDETRGEVVAVSRTRRVPLARYRLADGRFTAVTGTRAFCA